MESLCVARLSPPKCAGTRPSGRRADERGDFKSSYRQRDLQDSESKGRAVLKVRNGRRCGEHSTRQTAFSSSFRESDQKGDQPKGKKTCACARHRGERGPKYCVKTRASLQV